MTIGIKFQFFLHMKGRYNACVMHNIWIPYSNGFTLKTYFGWTHEITTQYKIGDFTTYSIYSKNIM